MKICTLSIAVAAAIALSTPLMAESVQPIVLNIATQSLSSALNEFAQLAKLQLIVDSKLLEGKKVKPITGEMSSEKALERLLEGSGLEGKIDNGIIMIQAQSHSTNKVNSNVVNLKEVTVTTASGFEQNIADAPASITVITGAELNKKSYTSVADAIKNVPGVYLSPVSGQSGGVAQDISIRGMTTTETLYLVDGKPISSGKNFDSAGGSVGVGGLQSWLPPISMIERIEIIRGPMSSLYGSNALGGVINIITKKATKEWSGSVTTEYLIPDADNSTSGEKVSTNFSLSGPLIDNLLALQVNGSFTKTDSVTDDEGNDLTGKELKRFGGKLIWTPDENNDIALEYNFNKQEATESSSSTTAYDKDIVMLSHDGRYGDWITSTYYQYDKTTNLDGATVGTKTYDRLDEVNTLNTQASYFWDKHVSTFGGQYKYEEYENKAQGMASISGITHVDRWLGALYAEDEWKLLEDFALTLGLRYNDDELFGGYLTPRVYGVYHLSNEWTFKAGVSTGYNQPGLTAVTEGWGQTRGSASTGGVMIGNPDLEPEETISYETGFNYANKDLRLNSSLMLFRTDYKNKIVTNRICTKSLGQDCTQWTNRAWVNQFMNVADAEMQGVEVSFDYEITETLKVSSSYTYTESEMKNAIFNAGQTGGNAVQVDLSGMPLNKTPKHMFNLALDWDATPKWNLWSQFNYRGKASDYIDLRSTVGRNDTTLQSETPAYSTMDLGFVYHATKALDIKAGVYNIANKEIMSDEYDITLDGRRYQASFTYNF